MHIYGKGVSAIISLVQPCRVAIDSDILVNYTAVAIAFSYPARLEKTVTVCILLKDNFLTGQILCIYCSVVMAVYVLGCHGNICSACL